MGHPAQKIKSGALGNGWTYRPENLNMSLEDPLSNNHRTEFSYQQFENAISAIKASGENIHTLL